MEKTTQYVTLSKTYNWKSVPNGTWFSAIIKGKKCIGKIYHSQELDYNNNNMLQLCQSIVLPPSDWSSPDDFKYGFKYGYLIAYSEDTDEKLEKESFVKDFKFLDKKPANFKEPKSSAPPPRAIIIDDKVVIFKEGNITVGCQDIPNSVVREIASRLRD